MENLRFRDAEYLVRLANIRYPTLMAQAYDVQLEEVDKRIVWLSDGRTIHLNMPPDGTPIATAVAVVGDGQVILFYRGDHLASFVN